MKIREVMRSQARTCHLDDDLAAIGRLMGEAGCGVLPVVVGEKVVGVVTDRDLAVTLARGDLRPSEVRVKDLCEGVVYSCTPDASVLDALDAMAEHRVRRLVVVGDDQRLEGLVSLDDIVLEVRGLDAPDVGDAVLKTLRAINEHLVPMVV